MEYVVLDNFTPKSLQDRIEHLLMFSEQVTWQYRSQTGGVSDTQDPDNTSIRETFQHSHDMYAYDTGGAKSPLIETVMSNMYFIEQAYGPIEMLHRVKANLLIKDVEAVNTYHPPHVDSLMDNSLSMVYYVNDSDGDTILFDKQVDHTSPNRHQHLGLTEIGRVSPKKGRAVIFNSNRFHASSMPIDNERRVVINTVFLASSELNKRISVVNYEDK
jgi:hypothetical protein|tara:strand:+ start:552 stop:1199 length:648 start_codon:yes stop_codon:yes gene_type:complete